MIIDFKQIRNAIKEKVSFDYEINLSSYRQFGEEIFKNPISIRGQITNHLGVIKLFCNVKL